MKFLVFCRFIQNNMLSYVENAVSIYVACNSKHDIGLFIQDDQHIAAPIIGHLVEVRGAAVDLRMDDGAALLGSHHWNRTVIHVAIIN